MNQLASTPLYGFEHDQDGSLLISRETVRDAWVDHNGHMNVASYLTAFDAAICAFCTGMAIGPDQIAQTDKSIFVAQANLVFKRELMRGAPIRISLQVLGLTAERAHVHLSLHDEKNDCLAAGNEQLLVCVDMTTRRPSDFPKAAFERFQDVARNHENLPPPRYVGRRIVLK